MARRELSSTLKNLKFMQRATLREEKSKPVEPEKPPATMTPHTISASGTSTAAAPRRCIVIMEGNPHPGAVIGRMSFQNFNPSIDNLNKEDANNHQMQTNSLFVDHRSSTDSESVDGVSVAQPADSNVAILDKVSDLDLKRKQPETEAATRTPQKLPRFTSASVDGQTSSQNNKSRFYKQQKREKLDWNVLRP